MQFKNVLSALVLTALTATALTAGESTSFAAVHRGSGKVVSHKSVGKNHKKKRGYKAVSTDLQARKGKKKSKHRAHKRKPAVDPNQDPSQNPGSNVDPSQNGDLPANGA